MRPRAARRAGARDLDHAHRRARHAGRDPRGAAALLDVRGVATDRRGRALGGRLRRRRASRTAPDGRGAGARGRRARDERRPATAGRARRRQLDHLPGDDRAWREGDLGDIGLITIDAHHDLRDGATNGSPVRRLVEAGLPGATSSRSASPTSRTPPPTRRAPRELGITVIPRAELAATPARTRSLAYALDRAGAGGRPVFVDIDVDVCDRAEVPGCPSAAPGGLSADELRELAFLVALDPRVVRHRHHRDRRDDRRAGRQDRAARGAARARGGGRCRSTGLTARHAVDVTAVTVQSYLALDLRFRYRI